MSLITTHVLDVSKGKPVAGIKVKLFFSTEESWQFLAEGITNAEGRIGDLLEANYIPEKGVYKLNFESGKYFQQTNVAFLYPSIDIIFKIENNEHYHIPLLLNPFGYTTYRGS